MSDDTRAKGASTDGPDPAALAGHLAKLTSGWKPAAGIPPEALPAARSALTHSLLAGRTLTDMHAVRLPVQAAPPVSPALEGELLRIATEASAAARPATAAVVRSAAAASIDNPA